MRDWLIHRMQREGNGNSTTVAAADEPAGTKDNVTETTRLLAADERFGVVEEIAMDTFSASFITRPPVVNEPQVTDDDDAYN